jgi:DNA-dependent protein kinase catalytic subunit
LKTLTFFQGENDRVALKDIQMRILSFLGYIGGLSQLILSDSLNNELVTELAWDDTKQLKFSMPMENFRAYIYLGKSIWCTSMHFSDFDEDGVLPLIVDLAVTSPSRERKIAAGELLHSLILFMVGSNAHRPTSRSRHKNDEVT